jgi:hypothetical protein
MYRQGKKRNGAADETCYEEQHIFVIRYLTDIPQCSVEIPLKLARRGGMEIIVK